MGDKDYIKPLLENAGQVHFGKVCRILTLLYLRSWLPHVLSPAACQSIRTPGFLGGASTREAVLLMLVQ